MLVNCDPWTPFCLSSGDPGLTDLFPAAHDDAEDFPSDVTFQCPDCIELGMARSHTASDILLGLIIGPETANCNDVEGAIGKSVARRGLVVFPEDAGTG
ncbi:hypothetical protein D3C87_1237780 [compost metagenome]